MGEDMQVYPEEQVVGIVDDGADVQRLLDALEAEGVAGDRVEVLAGEEGKKRLDATGEEHGWAERALRTVQKVLGDEAERLENLNDELAAGNYVVQVEIAGEEDEEREASKLQIGDIMRQQGGRSIAFYGKYQIQELTIGG